MVASGSLPRRTFLSLVLLPVLPAAASFGDAPQADDSPAAKLRIARDLLNRGLHYERAATHCREALKDSPDDWQIWATLGCALTARAASIAHAAYANDSIHVARQRYELRLRMYRIDKERNGYKGPAPFEPPAAEIRFKDDAQPYNLTYGQLGERFTALLKEATAAFEQAKAKAKTPAETAEATYFQAWGLRLLWRHGLASIFPDFPATPDGDKEKRAWETAGGALWPLLPTREAILQAFEDATKADPENAIYWESLGDVCSGELRGMIIGGKAEGMKEKAVAACEKSLELKSRNARLWYRLSQWRAREPGGGNDAARLLRNAARREPGNAWYSYEEAALLTLGAPYSIYVQADEEYRVLAQASDRADAAEKREAARRRIAAGDSLDALRISLKKIEQANSTGRVIYPEYRPPVPRLLSAAWSYTPANSEDESRSFDHINQMASMIAGYADYSARQEKNLLEAERACNLLIVCGEKLANSLPPVQDIFRERLTQTISWLGDSVAATGYAKLAELLREAAPDRAAEIEAKSRAVRDRIDERIARSNTISDYRDIAYLRY